MHPPSTLHALFLLSAAALCASAADYRAPLMAKPPAIDGKIDRAEWRLAIGFDGFAFQGQLDRRRARAWVGATKTHLYLAIRSQLPDDGPLKAQVAKDTVKVVFDDSIEAWIDPTPGAEHGQTFQMLSNPLGKLGYKHHARGRDKEQPTWRGNWQIANGFHDGYWHVEVAVPIADLVAGRTADQGAWGINLCRNWKEPWGFSSIGGGAYAPTDRFTFVGGVSTRRGPRDGDIPPTVAIRHESRADAFVGDLHHALILHNPTKQPIPIKARLEITRDAMPELLQDETLTIAPGKTRELIIQTQDDATRKYKLSALVTSPDGKLTHYARSFAWTAGKPWRWVTTRKEVLPIDFQFAYYPYLNQMRVLVNTTNLPEKAKLERLLCIIRRKGEAKPIKTVTVADGVAHIPGEPEIAVEIDRERAARFGLTVDGITRALEQALKGKTGGSPDDAAALSRLLLPGPGGARVPLSAVAKLRLGRDDRQVRVEGAQYGFELSLPPLKGPHEIALRAEGVGVPQGELVKELDRTVYDWEHKGLGTSTRVYPPFTPIKVEGKKVSTVLREHTMNDLGLWDQVVAAGKPLLAAPMRLVAVVKGAPIVVKPVGRLRFSTKEGHEARASAEMGLPARDEHGVLRPGVAGLELMGPVRAQAFATWDYDGVMRVDLSLNHVAVDALRLEIPLKDEMAPMIHAMGDGIRNTIYTRVPKGEGVVWDASKCQVNDFPPNWCSYIYVGSPSRGLCWFAENDRDWEWDRAKPNVDLVRKGGQLILRIHLINRPVVLPKPITKVTMDPIEPPLITFGLLAAPVKPRIANWRYIWKRENYTLLGTDINWLARGNCGSVYPAAKDLWLWEMLKRGNREKLPREEVEKVIARGRKYFEPYGPEYVERFTRHVPHNLLSRHGKKMVFYYNRASCQLFPEFQTFQDEWCLTDYRTVGPGNGVGEIKIVPSASYIDHALHWYGKSFEIGGNQGVYWDNMYLRASYNTTMTSAYEQPDGSIMPSNGIWGLRELVKRTFVLMNERGMRPITMTHMTSTGILPILSFCTVQYDWEWKYSQGDFQYRYTPEYIQLVTTGELAGAWPVLLGDHGKLSRDEWTQRTFAGVCLVHELDGWGGGKAWGSLFKHVHRMVETPGLEVYRYWDDRPQPVKTGHADLPAIVYSLRGKEAVIGVTSYAEKDLAATITIDPKPLGLEKGYRVVDAETDEAVACENHTLKLTIKKHGVRELRLLAK